MTPETILEVVKRKAELHPELRRQLGWTEVRRICARENIGLFVAPLPRPAQLVQFDGAWSILLDDSQSRRRHTYFAAHELGHLWLHHDATAERWERVYNMDDWEGPDPREEDVETFCNIVLGDVRYV